MSAPLLKDVFDIPESVGAEDYVLRLTDATSGRGIDEAIDDYVVTPDIADAFDDALKLIADALGTGLNRGAFLAGSFGAGKSHFMAVLHALLRHNPKARAHRDLQRVVAAHDQDLQGKNFLPLSFHFLGGRSMEQVLFDGYVDQVRALHPDAPLPAVYATDALLADAENLRKRMGDDAFLAALGSEGTDDDMLGALLDDDGWSRDHYQAALAAAPTSDARQELVKALTGKGGLFSNYARLATHVSLDEGLAAISTHARGLGYDAVVMFLDELVLWLAFEMQNHSIFGREAQKLTKLVEGSYGRLETPLISVIARQMDLQRWFAGSSASGGQQKAIDEAFSHQSGRFAVIELGDDNLAHVAARRLLQPKDEDARRIIQEAFEDIDRREGVWDVLLDGINTDEHHHGAGAEQFRLTYPFSPALVSTLRDLSSVMQRDRTALKVMQEMLVDRRETMTIDEVIPVGDAYPYVVQSNDRSVLDPQRAALFRSADVLLEDKLRPAIRSTSGVTESDIATGDESALHTYRMDERLAHTLLLSAVAPGVPALKSLTASRLSSLNHGSITSPLRGGEAGVVASKVKVWAQRVGDIRISGSDRDPVYTVNLSDVDYESILERARIEDNPGRQRELLQRLFLEATGVTAQDPAADGALAHDVVWRASRRRVDLVFGNVRDSQQLPGDRFRHAAGTWRLIIDLPFDEPGRTPQEDMARIDELIAGNLEARTLIWLPRFLSQQSIRDMRRLVVLDYVLTGHGDRWRAYADHLSEADRTQAKVILEGQQATLRSGLLAALTQAYGAATPEAGVLAEGSSAQVLWSLEPGFTPPTPGGPSLDRALAQTIAGAWDHSYPDHPRFAPEDQPLTARELGAVVEHIERAAADPEHRVPLKDNPQAVRRIADAVGVGRTSETHFLFSAEYFGTWSRILASGLAARGLDNTTTVTVGELRDILREHPVGAGLDEDVLDLVIIGWATLQQRAWYRYQAPFPQIIPGKLARDIELRPQEMPTREEWETARTRAAAWFGLDAPAYLTASNVTRLAETVHQHALPLREHARSLAAALRDAHEHRRLAEGPRLTAARQGAELIDALATLQGLPLLRRVTSAEIDATDQELGRSLASAESVTAAVRGLQTSRIEPLAAVAGHDRDAAAILRELDGALSNHELIRPLPAAITTFLDAAWSWSTRSTGPDPEPQPRTPARRQGRTTLTWSPDTALSEVAREITEQVDDGARVEITWRELP